MNWGMNFPGKTHFFFEFFIAYRKSRENLKSPILELTWISNQLFYSLTDGRFSSLSSAQNSKQNIDTKSKHWKSSNRRKEIENVKFKTETLIVAELMNLVSLLFSFRRFEKRLAFLQKSKSRVLTFKTSP